MHIKLESHFRHIIQWLAGSIAVVITVVIPAEHFYTGYEFLTEVTQNKAHYIADDMSEFVFMNSDTWIYQEHRYIGIIEKYADVNFQKSALFDIQGKKIFSSNTLLPSPLISVNEAIFDANKEVASIQLQTSLEPLLIETLYSAISAILFGILIYVTLYRLPMFSLKTVIKKLDDSQLALQREIENKEQALQEAQELGQKLHIMAMHDTLTGLPNRNMYHDRLSQAVLLAERKNTFVAVVMLDLNRFKEVNDSVGHHVGDVMLVEIAKRLKSSIRKSDTVSRLGGDEFALVLHIDKPESAVDICHKLSHIIKLPIDVKEPQLQIKSTGSFGIAHYPEHGKDSAQLLQKADVAMYVAKKTSTNIAVYDQKLDTNTPEKLRLVQHLNQAIVNNELFLVYQPKINLDDSSVIGVEALVRWNHPQDGLIAPGQFIPLAEESEIIHPLTEWVIETALSQQQVWKALGVELHMSINISGKNLLDDKLHIKINSAITKNNTNPADVIFEVTESAMIDDPMRANALLQEISKQGLRLSIDDFGTGHASLMQLKTFPFDELKVDRSFVKDMLKDANDAAIVRSSIALANSLNMKTVAEGIEDELIIEQLKDMGCELAQGFFWSKPLTSDELIQWLGARPDVLQAVN